MLVTVASFSDWLCGSLARVVTATRQSSKSMAASSSSSPVQAGWSWSTPISLTPFILDRDYLATQHLFVTLTGTA